jgi:ribonuclease R
MFRVHDQPSVEKMESLRETLAAMDIRIAKGQVIKPALFQKIVSEANGTPEAPMINMAVLRSQSQAEYSPANIGHFGLALRRYAHFTSPIRRYSDLLVHRSLVTLLGLGEDGLGPDDGHRFAEMGKQVSLTERRAVDAEREAVDRFTTIFLSEQIGAEFSARVNGTHRAGLFITLEETGADGLIPMSLLGQDRFDFVTRSNQIKGRETGTVFSLGDTLTARLEEANVDTGSLLFSVVEKNRKSGTSAREGPRQGKRGRKKVPSKRKRVQNSRK